jgi:1-acyl-sn-glycerol-3-phosphate acyltransferase
VSEACPQREASAGRAELDAGAGAGVNAAAGNPLRRNWVWFSFQVICRIAFTVWLRYRARGIERLPASGGALLLSNHQSFLDPLLIGLPLRRPVSFLGRKTLFPVPVIGWILRHTYVMPLDRDGGGAAGLRETLRRLDQGFLVGIFPEGTRSSDGALGIFKPGFAALVRRTDLPIFPVGIAGANRAMGRGSLFLKPRRVCVVFGEPFPKETIDDLRQRGRESALVEAVRERIAQCQHEAEAWLAGTKPPGLIPAEGGNRE